MRNLELEILKMSHARALVAAKCYSSCYIAVHDYANFLLVRNSLKEAKEIEEKIEKELNYNK